MRLIDADALKQTFCAECNHSIKCDDCDIDYHFNHAPTVETEHGHWIHEFPNVGHLTHFYLCSVCRAEWNAIDNDMERFDYCPSCGAKMDERREE